MSGAVGLAGPDDPAEALDNPHAGSVNRLRGYLAARFPAEVEAHTAGGDPDPVTLACRLLDRLPLAPGTGIPPCPVAHCNKPPGHTDGHGPS